jgi:hypothetical protein
VALVTHDLASLTWGDFAVLVARSRVAGSGAVLSSVRLIAYHCTECKSYRMAWAALSFDRKRYSVGGFTLISG